MQINISINPAMRRMPMWTVPRKLRQRDLRHVRFQRESIIGHDRQNISRASKFQVRRQIESEWNKAGAICAKWHAIQINLRHLPHGLELDVNFFVPERLRRCK